MKECCTNDIFGCFIYKISYFNIKYIVALEWAQLKIVTGKYAIKIWAIYYYLVIQEFELQIYKTIFKTVYILYIFNQKEINLLELL